MSEDRILAEAVRRGALSAIRKRIAVHTKNMADGTTTSETNGRIGTIRTPESVIAERHLEALEEAYRAVQNMKLDPLVKSA